MHTQAFCLKKSLYVVKVPHTVSASSYLSESVFNNSITKFEKNPFYKFLLRGFGSQLANDVTEKYKIGTSELWGGSTVFWQIDIKGKIRTGKIINFDAVTGHRIKKSGSDGVQYSQINWVHSLLIKKKELNDFKLQQCFFGEHLLNSSPGFIVGIVESEKTAVLASIYLSKLIWLACGSLNGLSMEKCKVLEGRKIILFPDEGCLSEWEKKADEMSKNMLCNIKVSRLLGDSSSNVEMKKGMDLADFFLKFDDRFGWALSDTGYPIFWDH